jgi:putative OPT family oligopeptide transporter
MVLVALPMTIFMVIFGFLFSAVGAYMSGVVGSSNNPISGMTLATILTSSLLLLGLLKQDAPILGPTFAISIGSVVCCAAAVAGDNMQDLKSGHIIGATPMKQQIMQLVGVIIPAIFIGPIVKLLITAYGLEKSDEFPRPLIAPQAQLMASVSKSVFHASDTPLPWIFLGIGIGVAAVIILADFLLFKAEAPFRIPVLAAALGMYLPFELAGPIVLGGIVMKIAHYILRRANVTTAYAEMCQRNGLLFAAGLITGEAVVGILLAIPIVILKDRDFMAISDQSAQWPGIILLAFTMVIMLLVVVGKAIWGRRDGYTAL